MGEDEVIDHQKLESAMDDCTEVESLLINITDEISSRQAEILETSETDDDRLVGWFDEAIAHLQCARSKFAKDENQT